MTIKYHYCYQVGKNKTLAIKDGQYKVLKEWRFADVALTAAPMLCDVKDIFGLVKGNESAFKLYYSSSLLPYERLLTTMLQRMRAL